MPSPALFVEDRMANWRSSMRDIIAILSLSQDDRRSTSEIARIDGVARTSVGEIVRRAHCRTGCWRRDVGREGVTLDLLWPDYEDRHPNGYLYSGFCEHYRRWSASYRWPCARPTRRVRSSSSTMQATRYRSPTAALEKYARRLSSSPPWAHRGTMPQWPSPQRRPSWKRHEHLIRIATHRRGNATA